MGCDIHLFLEGLNEEGDYFSISPRFDSYYKDESVTGYIFQSRNYLLFSLLAGVRNAYNLPTLPSVISGLPNNGAEDYYELMESRECHSPNYLYLKDLVIAEDSLFWKDVRKCLSGCDSLSDTEVGATIALLKAKLQNLKGRLDFLLHCSGYPTWDRELYSSLRIVYFFDN